MKLNITPELNLVIIESRVVSNKIIELINICIRILYRRYVKHIPFLRLTALFLRKNLYFIYINHLVFFLRMRSDIRWRSLENLSSYVEKFGLPRFQIFEAVRVDTPVPNVTPRKYQGYLVQPHEHYIFPAVYATELSDGIIYGGSNLIFTQNEVICHDLYDFERDYTCEEFFGRHLIDAKSMRMRLLKQDLKPEKIEEAAAFVDACSNNYAHWLTEVLPRIAAFCSLEQFEKIPLIVDARLHQNIMDSLSLIVGSKRKIFCLPAGQAVQVDKLYITSVTGYVPYERRNKNILGHSNGQFCPPALRLIYESVSTIVENFSTKEYPKKIYIRRTSNIRKVTNGSQIEEFLMEKGFSIIEPEKLSFLEQVILFKRAEYIVGPSGAALSNLIFSSKNVECKVLIGKFKDTSYWYWQNIACSSGKTVDYIFGSLMDKSLGIHADYSVDIENLEHALREF